jgi:hypothetical protein
MIISSKHNLLIPADPPVNLNRRLKRLCGSGIIWLIEYKKTKLKLDTYKL